MLEKKKMEVEWMRVKTARMELELKIAEREDEIKKLKEHIEIQTKKEQELKQKLGE